MVKKPKQKPAPKKSAKAGKKRWRKPRLEKHGVLSIVEGD